MRSRAIVACLLFAFYSCSIYAQYNSIINYHINENNKKDLNQIYINTKTAAIKGLDNNCFESGYIIRSGDTVKCQIHVPKHKINDDFYLYILAKLSEDSIHVLCPKDISDYTVNGIEMRAHRSAVSGDTNYFFIKLIERGTVTLYGRADVPSDREYLYYFERTGDKELQFLSPYKQCDRYIPEGYYGNNKETPLLSKYSAIDEAQFRAALSEYLKDCEGVRNKLSNQFYTVYDVETIIRDYNSCRQ